MTCSRREVLQGAAGIPLALLGTRPSGSFAFVQDPQAGGALEKAPRIELFERMAFGMFVHWGLYSQIGRGEWAKNSQGIATKDYMRLMQTFTAKEFSGRSLARVARRAGMKYVTLTSRHHDGFSLYGTQGLSPYDVTKTPAGRDLILDFVEGCREEGIVPMLYCTTLDWSDPRFENDFPAYQQYLRASIEILCKNYGTIGGFWFDGNWSKPDADWETDALYAVIREHQPVAMIINNTGIGEGGKVGHPEIDSVTFERGLAEPIDRTGHDKYVAGEMCHTMNFHWGVATADFNYLSPAHVIENLCLCRRAGANLLMNVGPTAEGGIPPYERAALARVGDWLAIHGGNDGPLYHGKPAGIVGAERDFGLVQGGDEVYLFIFDLTRTADTRAHVSSRGPGKRSFAGVPGKWSGAEWLDNGEKLKVDQRGDQLVLHATAYPYGTNTVVRVARLTA